MVATPALADPGAQTVCSMTITQPTGSSDPSTFQAQVPAFTGTGLTSVVVTLQNVHHSYNEQFVVPPNGSTNTAPANVTQGVVGFNSVLAITSGPGLPTITAPAPGAPFPTNPPPWTTTPPAALPANVAGAETSSVVGGGTDPAPAGFPAGAYTPAGGPGFMVSGTDAPTPTSSNAATVTGWSGAPGSTVTVNGSFGAIGYYQGTGNGVFYGGIDSISFQVCATYTGLPAIVPEAPLSALLPASAVLFGLGTIVVLRRRSHRTQLG
jgi:hypothetical protein